MKLKLINVNNITNTMKSHAENTYAHSGRDWEVVIKEILDAAPEVVRDCSRIKTESLAGVHPDDLAVNLFAAEMKAKLAKKRSEGYSGWQSAQSSHLSQLLRNHVEKGDPVDVANFAMMLHQNKQSIEKKQTSESDAVREMAILAEKAPLQPPPGPGPRIFCVSMPLKRPDPVATELSDGRRDAQALIKDLKDLLTSAGETTKLINSRFLEGKGEDALLAALGYIGYSRIIIDMCIQNMKKVVVNEF